MRLPRRPRPENTSGGAAERDGHRLDDGGHVHIDHVSGGTVVGQATGPVGPGTQQVNNPVDSIVVANLTVNLDAPARPRPSGTTSNLLPRNPAFTGRSGLLDQLAARLDVGPVAVLAVRGLGGIGKSSLALEYAHRGRETGRYKITWWVRADSPVTLRADLAQLAHGLGIEPGQDQQETMVQLIGALATRHDWLIVYDNAEQPKDLSEILPPPGGHVLITSRRRAWTSLAKPVDIGELTRVESVAFLQRRSGRVEPKAAGALAEQLGDLPLALAQAAAYVDAYAISFDRYLGLYREASQRLLAAGLDPTEYPHSVATTWLLHVEQLQRDCPAALEVLRLCAFLAPTAVPLDFIFSGRVRLPEVLAPALTDPVLRADMIGALVATSLVTRLDDDHIQVHRLVQTVTRHQLDEQQKAEFVHGAGAVVAAATPDDLADPATWTTASNWAPHALTVAEHTEQQDPIVARALRSLVAKYLQERGQYETAQQVLTRAKEVAPSGTSGYDGPDLSLMLLSADIKLKRGDLTAAREEALSVLSVAEKALSAADKRFGQVHLAVTDALMLLATLERRLMNLPAAHRHIQRALDIAKTTGNIELATDMMSNLALVYQAAGSLDGLRLARATYIAVLERRKLLYKPTDHRIGRVLGNLGNVELQLGDLSAACSALEQALVIFEAELGADHPEVGIALNNLGVVYAELGNVDKAERLLTRALQIEQTASGGRRTADAARALAMLAQLRHRNGESDTPRQLAAEALRIFQATLGLDHPETRSARELLAMVQRG